ncbi:unnamed protein product [Ilex paraguariensis]|uniref:RING-type E3 ubiquitin transferase n=1 Tax=Ilex paraguariensis TaxID=185542 RepID=A0ABC8UAD1_9AQUA
MQGQRRALDSVPETVDLNQESVPNNTIVDESAWNNMLTPVESRLSNYMLSSGEGNSSCMNASHNSRSFSGWDLGASSSGANLRDQISNDGLEVEHGWSSAFSARAGVDTRIDGRFEPSNFLLRESGSSSSGGTPISGGHLSMQSSGTNRISLNVNLNAAGYMGNIDDGDWDRVASDNVETSSDNSGYLVEDEDGSASFSSSWGLSCKRKALEGTSAQSYSVGSSSCFPQSEHIARHTVPARYHASSSLNITSPPIILPRVSNSEQLNTRIGVGTRVATFDASPTSSVTGIAENSTTNFGVRLHVGQQESGPFDLPLTGTTIRRSSICSSDQASRGITFSDSLDLRPTASVPVDSSNPPNQPHLMHAPGLPRNMLPVPWNGAFNPRAGSSSGSHMLSGDRVGAARDEPNLRSTLRNNAAEHSMFVSATESRNLVQDPANWNLAAGSSSSSGGVPSSSRIRTGSGLRSFPHVWFPHHSPPTQNNQRLPEFTPWPPFTSVESDSGGQRGQFSPWPSGPSSSSEVTAMSPGPSSRGHHQPHPRSAFLMEVPADDINGWRSLAADIEGRQRLVSEIRQVLNAMRRGENLRAEDYMLFDPFINGVAELHDRHRDMRLDVDNMSYEELLALEERIGNVNTGLSEETILGSMKQRKYLSIAIGSLSILEPCCICQEEYITGDDIGMLDCGHDFHTNCIKQWLTLKNLCPICKMTALQN